MNDANGSDNWAIETRKLTKHYGRQCVVNQLNLRVPTGGVYGLLGGLPAVAGYLTHRRWGVRVRCPSCGGDVLLRGEKCSGCAAEFPQPEMVGTEVFA